MISGFRISLIARLAAGSPSAIGIGSYGEEFDGIYAIAQVVDTTNDIYFVYR